MSTWDSSLSFADQTCLRATPIALFADFRLIFAEDPLDAVEYGHCSFVRREWDNLLGLILGVTVPGAEASIQCGCCKRVCRC